jgi:hypothetical protein
MIARELITDSGMKIWNAYYAMPPAKLPVSVEDPSDHVKCVHFPAPS